PHDTRVRRRRAAARPGGQARARRVRSRFARRGGDSPALRRCDGGRPAQDARGVGTRRGRAGHLSLTVRSYTMRTPSLVLAAVAAAVAVACSTQRPDTAQSNGHGGHVAAGGSASAAPVLYTSLGSSSHRITTTSPQAQRWFDQGLRLVYGF